MGWLDREDDIPGTVYCFTTCPDYTNNSTRERVWKCLSFPILKKPGQKVEIETTIEYAEFKRGKEAWRSHQLFSQNHFSCYKVQSVMIGESFKTGQFWQSWPWSWCISLSGTELGFLQNKWQSQYRLGSETWRKTQIFQARWWGRPWTGLIPTGAGGTWSGD